MKRRLEPVDLMVAIGVLATVMGGYGLYFATSGALQAAAPTEVFASASGADMMAAREWVQPALGRAIVDVAVIDRDVARQTIRAVRELNRASLTDQWLQRSPFGYLDRIQGYAAAVEADHAARVQIFMGRSIVNFTGRGIRSGVLSSGQIDGLYNRDMIGTVLATGQRMDEAFQEQWQGSLGQMIVANGQEYLKFADQSQGRVGRSIVSLAMVQDESRTMMEGAQEQLALVAVASIHGEQMADRFARLASAEFGFARPTAPLAQPRSWPEMPIGVMVAASTALFGLFFAGIFVATGRSERPRMELREEREVDTAYRKTA